VVELTRRAELHALLGALPTREPPISAWQRDESTRDGYLPETWDLDLNGLETVPALLARPRGAAGRRPAVVFNHSHGGNYTVGKTAAGRPWSSSSGTSEAPIRPVLRPKTLQLCCSGSAAIA